MTNNALVLWDDKTLRPVYVDLSLAQSNALVFVTTASTQSKGGDRHNVIEKQNGVKKSRRSNRATGPTVSVEHRVDSLVNALFKFSTRSTVTVELHGEGWLDRGSDVLLSEAARAMPTSVNVKETAVKTVAHLKIYELVSKTKSISDLHGNVLPFMLPWQLSCKLLTYPLLLVQEDTTKREVRPLTLHGFETHWARFFRQGYEQHCSITHTSRVDVPPLITPWFNIKSPTGVDSNNNHMAQIIKVLKKKLCLKDPVKSKKTTNKKAVKSKEVLDVTNIRGDHKSKTHDVKKKYKSKTGTAEDSYPPVCDDNEENEENEGGDDCIELMEEVIGGEEDDKVDCYDLFAVGQDEDEDEEEDVDDAEVIELADDDEEKDLVEEDNGFEDGDPDQEQDELEPEEDDDEQEDDDEPEDDEEVEDEFEDDDDDHDLKETTNDLTGTFSSNVTYLKPTYMMNKRTTGIPETSATVVKPADTTTTTKRKKQKL